MDQLELARNYSLYITSTLRRYALIRSSHNLAIPVISCENAKGWVHLRAYVWGVSPGVSGF